MLTPEQRSATVLRVVSDLRALFHSSVYWVSFIHLPRFFDSLLNPTSRASMQPSLVMSALAIGLFSQSLAVPCSIVIFAWCQEHLFVFEKSVEGLPRRPTEGHTAYIRP